MLDLLEIDTIVNAQLRRGRGKSLWKSNSVEEMDKFGLLPNIKPRGYTSHDRADLSVLLRRQF